MSTHKHITYVRLSEETDNTFDRLENDLNIVFTQVDAVSEIFSLLSNTAYQADLICIDLERLLDGRDGAGIFDIINTLSTLIKCTVVRSGSGKPTRRSTKICLLVSQTTTPDVIRQAMLLPDVTISMKLSGAWTYDIVKENFIRNLNGDFSYSHYVLDLLKTKKQSVSKKDTIVLIPREQQILSLIQDRGASNKIIAKMLDISESTVKLHIGKVLKKYGCKNRTQLALFSKKSVPTATEVQDKLTLNNTDRFII